MPKIVYPDADPSVHRFLTGERLARLEALGETVVHEDRPEDPAELAARIRDANAVILGWELPTEVMDEAPDLELVAFTGIGAGTYVDLDAAAARGVTVTNTPGYADSTVAEHALALLLALARRVCEQDAALKSGRWSPLTGMDLAGKALGLIGFGGIARRMGELGQGIGMSVTAWTPHPERHRAPPGVSFVALDDLLERSDAVSVHIAHTPDTERLLDARRLARMKPGALLVNTARGAILDEEALYERLEQGALGGAALDVFAREPVPAGAPLVHHPRVVATPHSAYRTPGATAAIYELVVEAIEGFYAGEPRYVVAAPSRTPR